MGTDEVRLIKLCGMFGSAHDGERANAARLADQLVRGRGLTWRDVIRPELPAPGPKPKEPPKAPPRTPAWQWLAEECQDSEEQLNDRERQFIRSILRQQREELSDKQQKWLEDIYDRLFGDD